MACVDSRKPRTSPNTGSNPASFNNLLVRVDSSFDLNSVVVGFDPNLVAVGVVVNFVGFFSKLWSIPVNPSIFFPSPSKSSELDAASAYLRTSIVPPFVSSVALLAALSLSPLPLATVILPVVKHGTVSLQ